MEKYAKGWASLVVTLITLVLGVITGGISAAEWLTVAGAFAGTVAVVGLPNSVGSPAVKAVAQAVVPIAGSLAAALITPEGITPTVLLMAAVASAGTLGVYGVTNKGDAFAVESGRHVRAV